jgi:hypothetical protein
MLGLEVPPSVAERDVSARLLGLETVAMLIQETSQTREQGPEAKDGSGTHQLVVITAQEVFAVFEEDLNGIITNDKFCMSRMAELQLSWWRRPLRLR